MEIISREKLALRIRQKYMGNFISFGVMFSLFSGVGFLTYSSIGIAQVAITAPFWILGGLFSILLLTLAIIQPYLYKKYKDGEVVRLEKRQAIALEYRSNPHMFIKKYLGIKGKKDVEQMVMNIQFSYLNNPKGHSLDFQRVYSAIKCNDKNKEMIEWIE